MRSIWKYELAITYTQHVPMPDGARVLCVQMQRGALTLWAEVDSDRPRTPRTFIVFGTGNPIPRELGYSDVYIGTVQDGEFVWHVYEHTGV